MDFRKSNYVFIKSGICFVFFLALHFLYDLMPIYPFAVIGCATETVFQHLKLSFFAFLFVLPVEYTWFNKTIEDKPNFVYSHLLVTFFIPWIQFVLWYICPAIVGELRPFWVELVYSSIIFYIMGVIGAVICQTLYGVRFNRNARVAIGILIVTSIFIFTAFSFKKPYVDVFNF